MKQELTPQQKAQEASHDIELALIENIEASKGEMDAKFRKKKAYYNLLEAKKRFRAVEEEIMQDIEIDYGQDNKGIRDNPNRPYAQA